GHGAGAIALRMTISIPTGISRVVYTAVFTPSSHVLILHDRGRVRHAVGERRTGLRTLDHRRVAARVVADHSVVDRQCPRADGVEEPPVVRDRDDGAREFPQGSLHDLD